MIYENVESMLFCICFLLANELLPNFTQVKHISSKEQCWEFSKVSVELTQFFQDSDCYICYFFALFHRQNIFFSLFKVTLIYLWYIKKYAVLFRIKHFCISETMLLNNRVSCNSPWCSFLYFISQMAWKQNNHIKPLCCLKCKLLTQ